MSVHMLTDGAVRLQNASLPSPFHNCSMQFFDIWHQEETPNYLWSAVILQETLVHPLFVAGNLKLPSSCVTAGDKDIAMVTDIHYKWIRYSCVNDMVHVCAYVWILICCRGLDSQVLWEMLTSEIPFKGLEGLQVAWLVVEKNEVWF